MYNENIGNCLKVSSIGAHFQLVVLTNIPSRPPKVFVKVEDFNHIHLF